MPDRTRSTKAEKLRQHKRPIHPRRSQIRPPRMSRETRVRQSRPVLSMRISGMCGSDIMRKKCCRIGDQVMPSVDIRTLHLLACWEYQNVSAQSPIEQEQETGRV